MEPVTGTLPDEELMGSIRKRIKQTALWLKLVALGCAGFIVFESLLFALSLWALPGNDDLAGSLISRGVSWQSVIPWLLNTIFYVACGILAMGAARQGEKYISTSLIENLIDYHRKLRYISTVWRILTIVILVWMVVITFIGFFIVITIIR
ncbi:hypothetical protein GF359_07565 [candidate division WOR-3 bacterium]|uniref:Uncharacterized protein n=1 Tax=candidate division WOR-3 bacterium TaxID=2052148 RepID=A0A9D5K9N9_UNCW3|nr:hypothetical protein [candidate division WOR-3 bacterium]MBD3365058.1 hypothetical protein [candidate division WOR-3 bacterium]